MNKNEFSVKNWPATIITSVQELVGKLEVLNLKGKSIKQIWNIGLIFDYDGEQAKFAELDEPIVMIFDDIRVEILYSDGGTVRIGDNRLPLDIKSYQGILCRRDIEKCLSEILNKKIIEIFVMTANECEFTGAFGFELPNQDEYIDEIVFKFESGATLHISAWYDFMRIWVVSKEDAV